MALNTDLLETSFAQIRTQEAEFTNQFYGTLFSDYPQVQPLFTHVKMEEQSKKLFASLVLMVNNLTKPDVLNSALIGLGTRHVEYGVIPEHYPMVGSALLNAMATVLKEQWTPDVAQAWTDAYAAITKIMLEGTDYPETILIPETE